MLKIACLLLVMFQDAAPTKPTVILPMTPVLTEPEMIEVPQPPKKEYPKAREIDVVEFDKLYVIESETELFLFQAVGQHLKVVQLEGPRTIFGRFSDGTGDYESRDIKSKHIYVLQAITSGKVELFVVPSGVTDRSLVKTIALTVGKSLDPAPTPDTVPVPDPDPTPVPKVGFKALLLIDELASPKQQEASSSPEVEAWLTTNCEGGKKGWQRWDKKSLMDPDFLSTEDQYWKELLVALRPTLPDGAHVFVMIDNKVHRAPLTSKDDTLKFLQGLKK